MSWLSAITTLSLLAGLVTDSSAASILSERSSVNVEIDIEQPAPTPSSSLAPVVETTPSETPVPEPKADVTPNRSPLPDSTARDVILRFPGTSNSALNVYLSEWGIDPERRYTHVFTGFSATLTDDQIDVIRQLVPSVEVSDDNAVSIGTTQTGAIWNLSSLDGSAVPPDSNYTYPTRAGADVTVYVLDTGRPPYATEFGTRLLAGVDFVGDGNGPVDCQGHGSHVAGTVAGSTFGVAKAALVRPLRVLNCSGSGNDSGIIAAIDWAVANNPAGKRAVINMSLGGPELGVNAAMEAAIDGAIADGIMVVVAAGNDAVPACWFSPANVPSAITVAAINRNNDEANFSNYGSCADVFAPGVGIVSIENSAPGQSVELDGTSMASPHVAGVAALYFSLHPLDSVAEAQQAILGMAEVGSVNYLHPSNQTPNLIIDVEAMNVGLQNVMPPAVEFSGGTNVLSPTVGATLRAVAAIWNSPNAVSTSRQWYSCTTEVAAATDALPVDCSIVVGQTGATFVASSAHVGRYLLVSETAISGGDTLTSYSASSAQIGVAVANTADPVVSGTAKVGRILSVSDGTWQGDPTSFAYAWYRCTGGATSAGNSIPAGCSLIVGATTATYDVVANDAAKRIVARVSASSDGSTWVARYTSSSAVVADTLVNSTPPIVNFTLPGADGNPRVHSAGNSVFTSSAGIWAGGTVTSTAYAWMRCDEQSAASGSAPSSCALISGAVSRSYSATTADVGKRLVARVTATSASDVATYFTASTPLIGQTPVNTVKPILAGGVLVGSAISTDTGTWSATPEASYAYQWYSCTSVSNAGSTLPAGCVAIAGATNAQFVLPSAQLGKRVLAQVKATNGSLGLTQSVSAYSGTSGIVVSPPTNSVTPVIKLATGSTAGADGKPTVRTTASTSTQLSLSNGTWTGSPTFTYQWFRCAASTVAGSTASDTCAEIAGANAPLYRVVDADRGLHIVGRVRATNAQGSVDSFSASLGAVTMAPVNTVAPALPSGAKEIVGDPLVPDAGTWTGSPAPLLSFQWYLCTARVATSVSAVPAGCTAISGATQAAYVPIDSQLGKFLTLQVSATNAATGTAAAAAVKKFTVSIQAVASSPALSATNRGVNGALKFVIGGPTTGNSSVSVLTGRWPNATGTAPAASAYTHQWYRCDDLSIGKDSTEPAGCVPIVGATTATYVVTANDVGKYISDRVRHTQSAKIRWTATTSQVHSPPANTVSPIVVAPETEHPVSVGSELTSTEGTWGGTQPMTMAYQWYACTNSVPSASNAPPQGCTAISGATSPSRTLAQSDVGKYIVVGVGATNAVVSPTNTWKYSASTTIVEGAPTNTVAPSISTSNATTNGRPQTASTLTASRGSWTGIPAPTFSYYWYRCDSAVLVPSSALPGECALLEGSASATTRSMTTADYGKYFAVEVRASNDIGETTIWSASTKAVSMLPAFRSDPSIMGAAEGGSTLTAEPNADEAIEVASNGFRWLRCTASTESSDSVNPNCSVISGATTGTYSITDADAGKYIAVEVTLRNDSGSKLRVSASTAAITREPANLTLTAPTATTGNPRVGGIVSATGGTWAGFPAPALEISWYRCDTAVIAKIAAPPANCSIIEGASGASVTVDQSSAGKFLSNFVVAVNEHGESSAFSPSSSQVFETPSFGEGPTVSGSLTVGSALTVSAGVTRGFPNPTAVFAWYQCTSRVSSTSTTVPAGCALIANQTTNRYSIVAGNVGKYIVSSVKLTNVLAAVTKFSASTEMVQSTPTFTSNPTLSGSPWVGYTLTESSVVSGSPTPTKTFEWFSCPTALAANASLSGCTLISDSTANSLVVPLVANAKFVVVRVTASNLAGSVTRTSASTTVVKQTPTNVVEPTISTNVAVVGNALTGAKGDWAGTPTIAYANSWYACSNQVPEASTTISGGCTAITGATSAIFTPTLAQERKFLVFGVSATNGTATKTYFSASTDAVASRPVYQSGATATPRAGTASSNGSPRVGGIVDATIGTWGGFPTPGYSYQWFTCALPRASASQAIGNDCVDVEGQTASSVTVTSEMAERYLGYRVTGTNFVGEDWRYSASTTLPVAVSPSMIDAPTASGYPFVDGILRTTTGSWTGSPDPTESVRWWVCTSPVEDYTLIAPSSCSPSNFEGASLTVLTTMVGKYLTAAVTSTNVAGSETAWTASLGPVTTGAINTVPPTVTVSPSGDPRNTGLVTANRGTWSGTPALTEDSFSYRWYRCDTRVTASSQELARGCAQIDDEFDAVHTIVEEDGGFFLLAGVVGENSQGSSTTFSASTAQVNVIPRNTSAPVISGRSFAREELTATTGEWVARPDPQFAYQWFLCADEIVEPPLVDIGGTPPGCSAVSGATASRYTPALDTLGKFAIVRVTASNVAGTRASWSATSSAIVSGPVNQIAPRVNITNPVLSKPVVPDSSLITDGGAWFGSPTQFAYQWMRCDSAIANDSAAAPSVGSGCVEIDSATAESYVPGESDRGKFLLVRVTATNNIDSTSHYSATSSVINMRPRVEVAPTITGKPFIENTVTAADDSWIAFPAISRTYRWIECVDADVEPSSAIPSGCSLIAGETSATLRIGSSLLGKFLFVGVSANNGFGPSAISWSAATTEVVTGPVNVNAPLISGVAHFPGKPPLTTSDGVWVGTPAPTISYQWYRCPAEVTSASGELPASCVIIDGATENAHQLSPEDAGFAIVVGVTGTNIHGFTTKFARSTTRVTEPVSLVSAPVIGGAPKVGSTLISNQGTWRGYPEPSTSHAWYSCVNRVVVTGSVVPAGCTAIAATNRSTLLLSDTQTGRYIVNAVTRTNLTDGISRTVTSFSASTTVVTVPVRLVSKPVLVAPAGAPTDSSPEIGGVWTASAVWSDPQPTVRYQWYRCATYVNSGSNRITELPDGCDEIPGATANNYTIAFVDRGKFITFAAIGTNSTETLTEWANSTRDVLFVPIATTLPTVSGERNAPELLIADPGVWEGSPEPTISYQWYRCTNPVPETTTTLPTGCELITGATEQTYQQTTLSDPGKYLTVRVMGASSASARTSYWVAVSSSQATAKKPVNTQSPVWGFPVGSQARLAVGEAILAKDDLWDAVPGFVRSYQWYSCEAAVVAPSNELANDCEAIDGATSQQYTLTQQDAENLNFFLAGVTASNIAGSTTKYSASTQSVVDAALVSVRPSEITTNNDDTISTSVAVTRGVWSKTGEKLQISYSWLHCSQPISEILSYTPNGCNPIGSASVYPPDDCPVANPLTALSLPEGSRYSGRYIALMEIVTPVNTTSSCVFTQKTRLATRVSVSTDYISESPKLWTGSATTTAVNPSVPLKMRMGIASAGAVGTWPAVYPSPTSGTWRGSPVGTVSTKWFRCDAQIAAVSTLENVDTPLPDGCVFIDGATNASYTPTAEDLLTFVGMDVTAANEVGATTVRTATSRPVTDDVKNTVAPTISTERTVGETVTAVDGQWTGTPTPAISRKWFLCPTASAQGAPVAAGCTEVVGETGSTLRLTPAAAGKFVIAQIIGQNVAYGATDEAVTLSVTTASSERILEIPVNDTAPQLTGGASANVGDGLVITAGTWHGTESPSYSYRWIACDSRPTVAFTSTLPEGCVVTPGSLKSLQLSSVHARKYLVGQEVATNSAGTTYASTTVSAQVTESPRNLTEPTISAQRTVGESITAEPGTWAGFPAPTLSYQWYACDTAATIPSEPLTSCTAIGPETTSRTFVIGAGQASKRIRVQEIARNVVNPTAVGAVRTGVGNKASISSEQIRMAPVFDGTPSVGGVVHVGMTATASTGVVRGFETPTYRYSWFACDVAQGASPASIPADCSVLAENLSSSSYVVEASAAGKYLIFSVTATNLTGSASKVSTTSASRVTLTPSISGGEPSVTGDAFVGGVPLTVSNGDWVSFPFPPTFTYQWYSCSTEQVVESAVVPGSCAIIAGATASRYSPTTAVQGKFILARVTAVISANAGGQASAIRVSKSTSAIKSIPNFGAAPTVTGAHHVGMTVNANATADGFSTPSLSYEWYHCASAVASNWTQVPATCAQISGESAASLTVPSAAAGRYLVVRVIATNSYTSLPGKSAVTRNSLSSVAVSSTPVVSGADPVISGNEFVGGTALTVSTGVWDSAPSLRTYSYAWYACSSAQDAASDLLPGGCLLRPGSGASYSPVRDDAGKYIVAKVTATAAVNSGADGSTDRYTKSTGLIKSAPVYSGTPTVAGVQQVGSTLTASASATGTSTPTIGYSWFVCSAAVTSITGALPATCSQIADEASRTLVIPASAAGKYIVVRTSATNTFTEMPGKSPVLANSASNTVVTKTPEIVTDPTLSGDAFVGGTALTVSNGTWSSFPVSPTFTYAWFSCVSPQTTSADALSADCTQIAGQTLRTYSPNNSVLGKYIIARVTATAAPAAGGVGTKARYTSSTETIKSAPQFTSGPTVSGTHRVGSTLTATSTVTGTSTPTIEYTWYQCSSAVSQAVTSLPATCSPINGANLATVTVPSTALGRFVVVMATATNSFTALPNKLPVKKSSTSTAAVAAAIGALQVSVTSAHAERLVK